MSHWLKSVLDMFGHHPRRLFSISFAGTIILVLALQGPARQMDLNEAERIAYGPQLPPQVKTDAASQTAARMDSLPTKADVFAAMERPHPVALLTPVRLPDRSHTTR